MKNKYSMFVYQKRVVLLIASILVFFAAAFGASKLGFSSHYRVFFSEDNPKLMAFNKIQQRYVQSDNVVFLFNHKSKSVYTPEVLDSISRITESAWKIPFSLRVDSLTNFQNVVGSEDELAISDLYNSSNNPTGDAREYELNRINTIRKIATSDPRVANKLVSVDGKVAAVFVTLQMPEDDPIALQSVVDAARKIQHTFSEEGFEVHLSGVSMMNNAFAESSQQDMATLIPMMLLVVLIGAAIMLRSIYGVILTFIIIIMTVISSMGLAGWLGFKLAPTSASAPIIILTIAVAHTIHLLVSYFSHRRKSENKEDAITNALSKNLKPIILTSVTTAVGFFTLNFSDVPPIGDLGSISGIGALFAMFYSLILLPAMVAILPTSKNKSNAQQSFISFTGFTQSLVNHKGKYLIVTTLGAVLLMSGALNNRIDDEFVKYFDESTSFRQAADYSNQNIPSLYTLEYSIELANGESITTSSYMNKLDSFSNWLRNLESVSHVDSVSDTIKVLNRAFNEDAEQFFHIPQNSDLVSQYFLLYEMSLPYGQDINNLINVNKTSTRVVVTLNNISSQQLIDLETKIGGWLTANWNNAKFDVSSPNLMFAHIGQINAKSMIDATLIALFAISILLILAFSSLKFGLISMLPNLIPVATAFGVWGLINGQIGLSVGAAAGVALGIVVDDTVHFLDKYLLATRQLGYRGKAALTYVLDNVGYAVITTSILLIVGFSVLTFSTFSMNADLGKITAITIGLALFFDFFFFTSLLMFMEKKEQNASDSADSNGVNIDRPALETNSN